MRRDVGRSPATFVAARWRRRIRGPKPPPESSGEEVLASIPPKALEAMDLARRGEIARAISSGEQAAAEAPDNAGLQLFLGLLHARGLDLDAALPHLVRAAALAPRDPCPRLELARVLIGLGRLAEAEKALEGLSTGGAQADELLRIRGLLLQRRGEHDLAANIYRAIASHDPRDFESRGQLGICLLALGDHHGAISALDQSLTLRPEQPAIRAKLAEAQAAAGLADRSLREAYAAARSLPYDPLVRVSIARLEDLAGRPGRAEAALGEALALDPACAPAMLALADLLERNNDVEALARLIDRMDAVGLPVAETAIPRARLLYRRGKYESALAAAMSSPEMGGGGARAQIIGQAKDRLGDSTGAFEAFEEMNRLTGLEIAGSAKMAADYRAEVARRTESVTASSYAAWSPDRPSAGRPAPAFLFGFPRSGTTLLDTMLAGHPDALVLEERPILHAVAEALGSPDRLAGLGSEQLDRLRSLYFDRLDREPEESEGRLVVDKLPLGIVDTALAHRIFPDARFVFVERHPCDVVLSCFMTRFDPKGGMANMLSLADTASLYDLVMSHWLRCRQVFPLEVHTIRYERVIEDPAAELRPLAAFLGLEWNGALLDHRRSARERAYIATPSYAQVAEPLYTRARGRWERYRAQLEPVLPILAPWCALMGYD